MVRTRRVKNVFLLGFSYLIDDRHETSFVNVPFRHNSASIMIEKWLRFKGVTTVRLVNIS